MSPFAFTASGAPLPDRLDGWCCRFHRDGGGVNDACVQENS